MRSVLSLAFLSSLAVLPLAAAPTDRAEIMKKIAAGAEGTWRKLDGPAPDLSSQELFSTPLVWCETNQHADRLERLFETAARMQDTDPASPGYGNFRWSWKHAVVFDRNAVEFSMRGGALLWIRHRETMPPAARDRLKPVLELGLEGCRRHKVRENYTNIALMNAGNLILLGEALEKPDLAKEGYTRLERVFLYTSQCGIHEFGSPTYYGVDLDDLLLIEAFCKQDRGREQARALLDLFWRDIALNFFPPSQRYTGAYSRNYDYLKGSGGVLTHLYLSGWIEGSAPTGVGSVFSLMGKWTPPAGLRELANATPRTVRQVWGPDPLQSRTNYLTNDISLGCAHSSYGGKMDFLLAADLPGGPDAIHCYFTPDGRGDPYGKKKIPESANAEAHEKALHLTPFWAAAQREGDVLALVAYRPKDIPEGTPSLESHFVMPKGARFTVGGRPVEFDAGRLTSLPVPPGEAVVLRMNGAALGLRLPWTNGAPAHLVFDGNTFGAVRLTIAHRGAPPAEASLPPSAVLWVRAGSGLTEDAAFARWSQAFAQDTITVNADAKGIAARCGAALSLSAPAPFLQADPPTPAPTTAVLELNGKDIGGPLLRKVEPLKSLASRPDPKPVDVTNASPTRWEAESGLVMPWFTIAQDAKAGGGAYVWLPGEAGQAGSPDQGFVKWKLHLATAGRFTLRANVLAPTPSDDSFKLRVTTPGRVLVANADWHLGVHPDWTWVAFPDPATRKPMVLDLPAGESTIDLLPREDGPRLDQLELVPLLK